MVSVKIAVLFVKTALKILYFVKQQKFFTKDFFLPKYRKVFTVHTKGLAFLLRIFKKQDCLSISCTELY